MEAASGGSTSLCSVDAGYGSGVRPTNPTIYFIQVDPPDGPVKIGFTGRRVEKRMAEGQTFAPQSLHLLVESHGTLSDEDHLHRIFQKDCIRGEWHQYSPLLRELVSYLAFEDGSLQTWLEAHS